VAIVKEHLVDGAPISELCDRHRIQPTQFYLWQKQLFENGSSAFERKTRASNPSPAERQVEALRAKLATKNEVIAELMEENVFLKKLDGAI
jgi:transposase-like protein